MISVFISLIEQEVVPFCMGIKCYERNIETKSSDYYRRGTVINFQMYDVIIRRAFITLTLLLYSRVVIVIVIVY